MHLFQVTENDGHSSAEEKETNKAVEVLVKKNRKKKTTSTKRVKRKINKRIFDKKEKLNFYFRKEFERRQQTLVEDQGSKLLIQD